MAYNSPQTRPARPAGHTDTNASSEPRCWDARGFFPFRMEVLTPVYIGNGDDITPLEYVLRKDAQGGGYTLHLIDTQAWLEAHCAESDVAAALESGDLRRIRRLMAEKVDPVQCGRARIAVSSVALGEALQRRITSTVSNSKAELALFMRNPLTAGAYIPGSSLKGALSTPLIDDLDNSSKTKLCEAAAREGRFGYSRGLEFLLGKIREHSMQALKVADIPIPPDTTCLVQAKEVRRVPKNSPGTPKDPCEALREGTQLYGCLHMDSASGEPAITLPGGRRCTLAQLRTVCTKFYKKRFLDEWQNFYAQPHLRQTGQALQPLQERITSLGAEAWLVRVGHYSHIECVTVTHNAPQNKKGWGKTRTLANGEQPFGWVLLHPCSVEEYAQGLAQAEALCRATWEQREMQQGVAREAQRAAAAQARQQREAREAKERAAAEDAARTAAEAAAREAALASLSAEERAIALLTYSDTDEAHSMSVYTQMSGWDAPLQKKAAAALRDFWTRLGKWQGKGLSKKQAEKVAKVRKLLE